MRIPAYGHGPWLAVCGLCLVGILLLAMTKFAHAQMHDTDPAPGIPVSHIMVTTAPLCSDKDDTTCPPQCRMDLTYILAEVPIESHDFRGTSTQGMWMGLTAKHVILLDPRWHGWRRDAVLQHEACHEKMWRDTGSPVFHP